MAKNVTYLKTSPWYMTEQNNQYLDVLTIRPIPAADNDPDYSIESHYKHRPDLMAFDLYGNAALWWVFAQRNMDVLKDPVYDFEPGTVIKLPTKVNVFKYLGI
jgi:hypothetical protein